MRKVFILGLFTSLIFSPSQLARAQVGVAVGPTLVLTKGDTENGQGQSCSFISTTELASVPLANRLLTIQPGDSPDAVATEMGFAPDSPASRSVMQWTSVLQGQYIKAEVKFRNQQAFSRTLTMATNYRQPNEKQCIWKALAQQEQLQQPQLTPITPGSTAPRVKP